MNRTPLFTTVLILVILGFGMPGCSRSVATPMTPMPESSSTLEILTFTQTTTLLPSSTVSVAIPTVSPEPTAKDTPTPTVTLNPTPTLTPRPTLPPDQAQKLALALLENNGGCLFPCWLGITPGITQWEDARAYFSTFTEIDPIPAGRTYYDFWIYLSFPKDFYPDQIYNSIKVENGSITTILAHEPLRILPLSKLLTLYGPPGEIRIRAEGIYMALSDSGVFYLVLFYPDKGIMAEYRGETGMTKMLNICPLGKDMYFNSNILLWPPEIKKDFIEAGQDLELETRPVNGHDIQTDYKPLEKVSTLDINAFYKTYKNPNNQNICFTVPDPDQ